MTTTIQTAHLQLIPHAPAHILALMEGDQQFEEAFGLPAADGLRDFYTSEDVSPDWIAQLRAEQDPDPWSYGFAAVHLESRSVIGSIGFKGPPDAEGMVEIAYGIVPDYQGRGFATEAAQAGVAFAFGDGRVRIVRAHTLPTNNASGRVLTKCGFQHLGEVVDPEDGLVWRWERTNEAV
jgi:[ribosomal protein S5]-alanine N-acetyltransferase